MNSPRVVRRARSSFLITPELVTTRRRRVSERIVPALWFTTVPKAVTAPEHTLPNRRRITASSTAAVALAAACTVVGAGRHIFVRNLHRSSRRN